MSLDRLLVTGASGFVGRRLIRTVTRAWPNVQVLALGHKGTVETTDRVRVAAFDLAVDDLAPTLSDFAPQAILHLAAKASVGQTARDPAPAVDLNLIGSIRLARAMVAACPGARLILASTGEVYGRAFLDQPVATETTPPQPQGVYARSKAAAEWMLEELLREVCPLTICRPFNHSGPGQAPDFVLPAFAEQIAAIEANGEGVIKVGDLTAARDFLHVDDVIEAYLGLMERAPEAPVETFNIASGRPVAIQALLDGLLALSSAQVRVETDPDRLRPSQVLSAAGDPARLMATTGWAPRLSLDTLLSDVLEDWRARTAGRAA